MIEESGRGTIDGRWEMGDGVHGLVGGLVIVVNSGYDGDLVLCGG